MKKLILAVFEDLIDLIEDIAVPAPDMNIPNYDRSSVTGNYMLVWLIHGNVVCSGKLPDFGYALRLSKQHKRHPCWVISGLESQLDAVKFGLTLRENEWFTQGMLDKELNSIVDVNSRINMRKE